jgi:hypothetical protein
MSKTIRETWLSSNMNDDNLFEKDEEGNRKSPSLVYTVDLTVIERSFMTYLTIAVEHKYEVLKYYCLLSLFKNALEHHYQVGDDVVSVPCDISIFVKHYDKVNGEYVKTLIQVGQGLGLVMEFNKWQDDALNSVLLPRDRYYRFDAMRLLTKLENL